MTRGTIILISHTLLRAAALALKSVLFFIDEEKMKIEKILLCLVAVALTATPALAQNCSGGGGHYAPAPTYNPAPVYNPAPTYNPAPQYTPAPQYIPAPTYPPQVYNPSPVYPQQPPTYTPPAYVPPAHTPQPFPGTVTILPSPNPTPVFPGQPGQPGGVVVPEGDVGLTGPGTGDLTPTPAMAPAPGSGNLTPMPARVR